MARLSRGLAAGCAAAVALMSRAEAHPHVWIDCALTLEFVHGQVVALGEEWSIDESESALILRDIVGEKPVKSLDHEAVAKLEKNAFSNLANYDYFTHVYAAGAKVGVRPVTDFKARLAGAKLVYDFTATLDRPVDLAAGPASFGVYDETYYVDVEPAEGVAPKLAGDGASKCRATLVEDRDHAIYYGSVFPKIVRLSCAP